jgi:hypothetical protein
MTVASAARLRRFAAPTAGIVALATLLAVPSAARAATATPAAAPAGLVAVTLFKATHLASVLPGLRGRQDDGGYAQTYPGTSFVSTVQAQTADTAFSVTLTAFASKSSAGQGFVTERSGTSKLPGVGNRAALLANEETLVLEGSQVLLVQVTGTAAGNDLIAAGDKSPAVLKQILGAPLLAATKALVHHMNGQPAKKAYTYLPAGARNPCSVTAASVKAKIHHPVVVTPAMSEQPPSQQCDYSLNSQPFLVQTYTHAQAVLASPPTTLDAVFSADLAAANGRNNALTATIGPVRLFMIPDEDWTAEALIESSAKGIPTSSAPAAADGSGATTHGLSLVRVLNGYTYTVSFEDCVALFNQEVLGVLADPIDAIPDVSDATKNALLNKVYDWCLYMTKIAPS